MPAAVTRRPVPATSPPVPALALPVAATAGNSENSASHLSPSPIEASEDTFLIAVEDEYDPFSPNEYAAVLRARGDEAAAVERSRQLAAAALAAAAGAPSSATAALPLRGRGGLDLRPAWMTGGSAAAAAASASGAANFSLPFVTAPLPSAAGGEAKAWRMMSKMGYSRGAGLGRDGMGITTPLRMVKTGRTSGVIRGGARPMQARPLPVAPAASSMSPTPPSRVLLIRNIVGADEVDDDLETEVQSECARHGEVLQVLVFLCKAPPGEAPAFAAEDACRVFVEFEQPAAAAAAATALDGRYFGQRRITARLYDAARFEALDLAPEVSG